MSEDAYRTVGGQGRESFEIQGSEFVGYVEVAETVAAAEEFVEAVAGEHPDATHVVPAYRVRAEPLREWADDAGEPTGSAGDPALNVLAQRDLENVVAVVIRYYGGTNLGFGGLARAYGRAVKAAVDDAGVVETVPHDRFTATVEYDDSGTLRSVLESVGVEYSATHEVSVTFEIRVPSSAASDLRDRLRSATSGRVSFEDS